MSFSNHFVEHVPLSTWWERSLDFKPSKFPVVFVLVTNLVICPKTLTLMFLRPTFG